jgi:hypothetical protein
MQKKLLELRCLLAGKDQVMNSSQAEGWLDIMRVVQIYDDMHDVVNDDGFQDNLLLSVAYHYFPGEWNWFCRNKTRLLEAKDRSLLLFLNMPCSMDRCMQMAKDKIEKMSWEQQKIMHYVLFKNSVIAYNEKASDAVRHSLTPEDFLLEIYDNVKEKMSHLPSILMKSYAVSAFFHLSKERKQLLKGLGFLTAYQLKHNLLSVSAGIKAGVFDRIVTR